jgi:ribonuclease P protein component
MRGSREAKSGKILMQSMREVRLRKHGDYQRVYQESRKYFSASMAYFYALRSAGSSAGPRIGLAAGRVLGHAVERNRIKRRMREAIRVSLPSLTRDVDLVLHPRRAVLTADFSGLCREVSQIFSIIEKADVDKAGSRERSRRARGGER